LLSENQNSHPTRKPDRPLLNLGGKSVMHYVLGQYTINQIGLVVTDLNEAIQKFYRTTGLGPWNIYTNNAPPLKCIYHGQPAQYKVRVAMARSAQVQMELIEYLAGDSIHRDFLASGKKGIEHLGIIVTDLDEALMPFHEMGIAVLQQVDGLGVQGDGRYAYLDTEPVLGMILELIQNPSQPRPPEQIYPMIY
jgi:methylmalonyl-CoA/ethylmalonyl-CoA epimerase